MVLRRRRPGPGQLDYELLWLLVSLGAGGALVLWLWARLPMPGCAFHSLTGYPCVTCGATRSAWQFLHGHFLTAFLFNPLAFASYCAIGLFDVYAVAVLVSGASRVRVENFSRREKVTLRAAAVALLAANWVYLATAGIV